MYALSNLMKLKDDKYVGGISYTINFIYLLHLFCINNVVGDIMNSVSKILEEVRRRGLMDVPFKYLTRDELDLVVTADIIENILKDSEVEDVITLREYSMFWSNFGYTPSKIFSLIKPYLEEINEELAKKGFVRVSKYTWRKFIITINEKKLKELANRLKLSEDEVYILTVAYKLLKITKPFVRDWKGYNLFDGFKILDIFNKFSNNCNICKDDIVKIGQKLLKYEEQIKGLGLDFDRIKKTVLQK